MEQELIRGRDLAQKIYNQITEHPASHRQGVWLAQRIHPDKPVCGTRGCIAGWAIAFNLPTGELEVPYVTDPDHYEARRVLAERLGLGMRSEYPEIAGELLGLDSFEAEKLFYNIRPQDALTDEQYAAEWLRNHFELEGNA